MNLSSPFIIESLTAFIALLAILLPLSFFTVYYRSLKEKGSLKKYSKAVAVASLLTVPLYYSFMLYPGHTAMTNWTFKSNKSSGSTSSGLMPKLLTWKAVGIEVVCEDKEFKRVFAEAIATELASTRLIERLVPLGESNHFDDSNRLDAILKVFIEAPDLSSVLISKSLDIKYQAKTERLNTTGTANVSLKEFKRMSFQGSWEAQAQVAGFMKEQTFFQNVAKHCAKNIADSYEDEFWKNMKIQPVGDFELVDSKVEKLQDSKKLDLPIQMPTGFELRSATQSTGLTTGDYYSLTYLLKGKRKHDLYEIFTELMKANDCLYAYDKKVDFDKYNEYRFEWWRFFSNKEKSLAISVAAKDQQSIGAGISFHENKLESKDWLIHVKVLRDFDPRFKAEKTLRLAKEALVSNDKDDLMIAFSLCQNSWSVHDKSLLKQLKLSQKQLIRRLLQNNAEDVYVQNLATYAFSDQAQLRLKYLHKVLELIKDKNHLYGAQLSILQTIAEEEEKLEKKQEDVLSLGE